jgi:hypothetical protein
MHLSKMILGKTQNAVTSAFISILFICGTVSADVPDVPIPPALGNFLIENEILASQPPPPGTPPNASWSSPIKFVIRQVENAGEAIYDGGEFLGETITDGGQYALGTLNTVVSEVSGGVQWASSLAADGVGYVVTQTADATSWTINTGLNGFKIIIRQTGSGVSWSVEKIVPDKIAIGGRTFVRFDPIKNIVTSGISYTVKISTASYSAAQATADYLVQTTGGLASGVVDAASGAVNLSLDMQTFYVSNSVGIASAMVDLEANKVVSRTWSALRATVTNVLNWGDLGWCGSTEGWYNIPATNLLVTDYWPPDEGLTNLVAIQAQSCRLFGLARLYKGCIIHDACYSVQGKTKKVCDDEARINWKNACSAAYGSVGYCYANCSANTGMFADILAAAGPAPYTVAQAETANNQSLANQKLAEYNEKKTRYNYISTEYPLMNKPQPTSYVPKRQLVLLPEVKNTPAPAISYLLLN